jgi:hypothetical protein
LPAATLNIEKQSGNYHIVAGAFRVEANSDKKVKQLQALGYKARKIGVNKYGLHEVVYASYSDRLEALKALRVIKKENNKDAWLKVDSDSKSKETSIISSRPKVLQNAQKTIQPKVIADATSKNSTNSTSESNQNFELEDSPNLIKILHNVKTVESGYYLILGAFSDISKSEEFIRELKSDRVTNIGLFFDADNDTYYIYNKRFNDLETALTGLQLKANMPYKGKMAIVKVEN